MPDNNATCPATIPCAACLAVDGAEDMAYIWTKDYMDGLPDSAFAVDGRHLPYRDIEGRVSKALLRSSIFAAGTDQLTLVKAAKEVGLDSVAGQALPVEASIGSSNWVVGLLRGKAPIPPAPPVQRAKTGVSVLLTKQIVNGVARTRVLMRVSNNFKDRHKEIITEDAHKEFVAYVDTHPEKMPEFWIWHMKGTRWGQADWLSYDASGDSGGFLVASGLVDEGFEPVAQALALLSPGVSHGFVGVSVTDKALIDVYRSFEFSPLPVDKAANMWTAMMLAKEAELPLPADKKKFLIEDLGVPETVVARLEAENKSLADMLGKDLGIVYKEAETPAPVVEPTPPTPAPPAVAGSFTLDDIRGVVEGAVGPLAARLDGLETKQKELEGGIQGGIEKLLGTPTPGVPNGHVATKSEENKVDPPAGAAEDDWFMSSPLMQPDFKVGAGS